MELTILGRYAPYPPPGGACNGYLVRHGGTSLLLDAGNGVAARLQERLAIEDLTAVVVSHLHEDHIADLHCLRFAQLTAQMLGRTEKKLQVYAPATPTEQRRWIEGGEAWQELHEYLPEQQLILGELAITFVRTNHPFPCYAMRIHPVGQEGPVLVYTGDTGLSEEVTRHAAGADLLLVEASLNEEYAHKRVLGHLTAAEAAWMAKGAEAKRCLLTHLWPGSVNPQQILDEARPIFPHAELAEEGNTYQLSP